MANITMATMDARRRDRAAEAREFRVALRLGFAVFLILALVSRLLPQRWRLLPGTGGAGRSVVAEAREAANTVIPLAFMR